MGVEGVHGVEDAARQRMLRRARRSEFFATASGYTRFVTATAGGLLFLVGTDDAVVGGKLFAAGTRTELHVLERTLACLREHGRLPARARATLLLDVGANIGTTTLPAVARHFEHAIAVEPAPANCLLLRANALLNGVHDRVTVVEAALSSGPGEGLLSLDPGNSGGHLLIDALGTMDDALADFMTGGVPLEQRKSLTVPVETLDRLVEQGVVDPERVDLVWMDAQGSEPAILQAAEALLARSTPIVVEVAVDQDRRWLRELAARYERVVDVRTSEAPLPATATEEVVDRAAGGRRRLLDLLFF